MKKLITALVTVGSLNAGLALAQELTITVTNLTNAVHFTPLLISAHNPQTHLFEAGMAASVSLQAMAEGGDISGLATDLSAIGATVVTDPAGGLLAPGASTSTTLMSERPNARLSLVAMLLPTNDGFVGLDSLSVPKAPGTYTYYLNAYDAGTEANDEIINGGGAPGIPGIPADPSGNGGAGASGVISTEYNTRVHIHPGVLGDTDAAGGMSDLDSRLHRWDNPVAKLVITVGQL